MLVYYLIDFLELVLLRICLVMVLNAVQNSTAPTAVCVEIWWWVYVQTTIGQSVVSAPSGQFILDIGIISTIDTLIDAVKTFGQVKRCFCKQEPKTCQFLIFFNCLPCKARNCQSAAGDVFVGSKEEHHLVLLVGDWYEVHQTPKWVS